MDVAGATGILVFGQGQARHPTLGTAHGAHHLQIVRTKRLPGLAPVVGIPVGEDLVVPAGAQPLDRSPITLARLLGLHIAGIKKARHNRLPVDVIEAVAERTAREQHHAQT